MFIVFHLQLKRKMTDFKIGSDPELVFIGPEGLMRCGDYYPTNTTDQLGADGHPWITELRPPPSVTPEGLTENIRQIFIRHKDDFDHFGNSPCKAKDVAWQGGSFVEGKNIGGHIHFGGTGYFHPPEHVMTALDGVLGQITLMMEDMNEARQRRASGYGATEDIREKPYGFEYRTPASFILSPQIAIGVFALAKALMYEEMVFGPVSVRSLTKSSLDLLKVDTIKFMRGETDHFKQKFPDIWDNIIRKYRYWFTPEGKEYWKNIALLRHIINNYPNWHNHRDILHRWGIRDFTPPSYIIKAPLKPMIQKAYLENRERAVSAEEVFERALEVNNPTEDRMRARRALRERRRVADEAVATTNTPTIDWTRIAINNTPILNPDDTVNQAARMRARLRELELQARETGDEFVDLIRDDEDDL